MSQQILVEGHSKRKMSIQENIINALQKEGFTVGVGQYPSMWDSGVKVIFFGTDKLKNDKSVRIFDDNKIEIVNFKVVVRSYDYSSLEEKINQIRVAMKKTGFVQLGEYEDVEPEAGEIYMELAINCKYIVRKNVIKLRKQK